MPITEPVLRGDAVRVNGREYVVRTTGTSVYLYADVASLAASRHVRTMRRYVLLRDGERVVQTADATAAAAAAVTVRRPAPRVTEHDIRYLYVVRDCDSPADVRRLKIGMTSSIPRTLRTFHRLEPNAQAIVVVDCEGPARPLERAVHAFFADFRVDRSEVFTIRPHEALRCLRRMRYTQGNDGIFRQTPRAL